MCMCGEYTVRSKKRGEEMKKRHVFVCTQHSYEVLHNEIKQVKKQETMTEMNSTRIVYAYFFAFYLSFFFFIILTCNDDLIDLTICSKEWQLVSDMNRCIAQFM